MSTHNCASEVQDNNHVMSILIFPPTLNGMAFDSCSFVRRDMECGADASIPGYSGYYNTCKQEIGNSGQGDDQGQEGAALNQLSGTSNLRLQLSEQYLYSPYANLNLPDEKKLKTEMEMNLQGNPVDYQVNANFEIPAPIYDNRQHTWVSASGPCSIAMFDENSFSQGNVPPIVHSAFPDSVRLQDSWLVCIFFCFLFSFSECSELIQLSIMQHLDSTKISYQKRFPKYRRDAVLHFLSAAFQYSSLSSNHNDTASLVDDYAYHCCQT